MTQPSLHPGPGRPDCHECGGSGTNAPGLPCSVCHRKANLAARNQRRADFVEAMADGDLPDGLLATTGQLSHYSAAVEATVEQARRDIYKNILAGLGVDYEEDASAMTLLLKANAEVERAAELREAARAVVEAFTGGEGSFDAVYHCTKCLQIGTRYVSPHGSQDFQCDTCDLGGQRVEDASYAPAWRRLVALVKP